MNGSEKLAWKWEAGIGSLRGAQGGACWKRKTIPQVTLQTGDEIKLIGSAGARVDFVEFVPHVGRAR